MLHLFIKTINGDSINIEVQSDSSVKKIKDEINKKNNISICKQKLMLNGNELEDDKKISEYNIPDYTTIHLIMKSSRIEIFIINPVNKKTTLEIDLEDTIKKLKDLYHEKTREHIDTLTYLNKPLDIKDDDFKLYDYGIQKNSTLFATIKLKGGKRINNKIKLY